MTNNTTTSVLSPSDMALTADQESWQIVVVVVNTILSVITICGNSLVLGAFWVEPSLRTKANYFIISLATADLLVGMIALPLYSSFLVDLTWESQNIWKVYDFADALFGVASIFNLLGVSLVSAHAIVRPLKHRAQRDIGYIISAFVFPWLCAIIAASVSIIGTHRTHMEHKDFTLIISIVFYFFPLSLIIIAYTVILNVVRRRKFVIDPNHSHTHHTMKQDLKAAMTMLIVIGCFVITWLPFFIVVLLIFHCTSCDYHILFDMRFIASVKIFQYAGSSLNPFIYAFRRRAFKRAFYSIYKNLCPFCKPRPGSVSSLSTLQSVTRFRRATSDSHSLEIRH